MTRISRSVLVATAIVSTGCAYGNKVKQGDAAVMRKDFVAAAQFFRQACALKKSDPGDPACIRATSISEEVTASSVADAKTACNAGDVDVCLRRLQPARKLSANDARVVEILDLAAKVHLQRCTGTPIANASDAFVLAACVDSKRAEIGTAGYETAADQQRIAASEFIAKAALDKKIATSPAAHYGMMAAAACLSGKSPSAARLEDHRRALAAKSGIPTAFRITIDKKFAAPLNSAAAAALSEFEGAVRAASGSDPAYTVAVRIEDPQHSATEEGQSLEYQAGTRKVPNAAYAELSVQTNTLDRQIRSLSIDAAAKRSDCDQRTVKVAGMVNCFSAACDSFSMKEQACEAAAGLESKLAQTKSELAAADEKLAETPSQIEEPIMKSFSYMQKNHQWTTSATYEIKAGDEVVASDTIDLAFEDVEHPAFAPADFAADPKNEPKPAEYAAKVADVLQPIFSKIVEEMLSAKAAAREAACSASAPWSAEALACWSEANLWRRADLSPAGFVKTAVRWSGANAASTTCR